MTFGGEGDPRGACRLLEVRVINEPMRGLLARWLLTNTATGCKVTFDFVRADGTSFRVPGRWNATPQPIQRHMVNGDPVGIPDRDAIPATLRFDLDPDTDGETLAVTIKREGQLHAFGFSSESYLYEFFENPDWRVLPGPSEVIVEARSGEVSSGRWRFSLANNGTSRDDLQMGPKRSDQAVSAP